MCGMMSSFKKGLQTSKMALRVLLLVVIANAIVTARYDCSNAPPKIGREEKKLTTLTTVHYNVTVMQTGANKREGQTPFDIPLPPGNYTVKVAMEFSSGTLAMAYFEDGRLIWESPCVVLNAYATIPLTLLSKANATVHLVWRDPHSQNQPTYSLAVFSTVIPPPPQVNGSAVGQPSTATHNTNATADVIVTGTPAPHLPNAAKTTGADQAGTTPTGDEFSTSAHSSTDCTGHKGCVSGQTSEQPTKKATEGVSLLAASLGGVFGGVVILVIVVPVFKYCRKQWKLKYG